MKIKKMSAKVLVNALSITKKNWKRSKNQLLPKTCQLKSTKFLYINIT